MFKAEPRLALPVFLTGGSVRSLCTLPTGWARLVFAVTPVTCRTEGMVGVAFPPCETTIVDIAVLLFAAIGVVGAFGSAFGTVNVIVAVATSSTADESHGAGALGAVGLLVHTHGSPIDPPPCFLLDPLADRALDGTGAIERSDI